MRCVWDARKASINLRKHAVSFEEAETALRDPMALTGPDCDHSVDENRDITFGLSNTGRLLVVCHAYRGGDIRIISARTTTRRERVLYEEG